MELRQAGVLVQPALGGDRRLGQAAAALLSDGEVVEQRRGVAMNADPLAEQCGGAIEVAGQRGGECSVVKPGRRRRALTPARPRRGQRLVGGGHVAGPQREHA